MTSQVTKLLSFILANVNDPAQQDDSAVRVQCYSCMSSFMEQNYGMVSSFYERPLSFAEYCYDKYFDKRYLKFKNCTDMCVTLRTEDRVLGSTQKGIYRGCLHDIKNVNETIARLSMFNRCAPVGLKQLFKHPTNKLFSSTDAIRLCTCYTGFCNSACKSLTINLSLTLLFILHLSTIW